jgi:hypothetical protein
MEALRATVELGRALRQEAGVKSRIPLAELRLFGGLAPLAPALGSDADRLLAAELNVRRIVREPTAPEGGLDEQAWVVRREKDGPVAALPRRPTDELLEEGWYRELARRLQHRRKELQLRYGDRVTLVVSARGPLLKAIASRRELLGREMLADTVELREEPLPAGPDVRSWEFAGVNCSALVRRSTAPARPDAGPGGSRP